MLRSVLGPLWNLCLIWASVTLVGVFMTIVGLAEASGQEKLVRRGQLGNRARAPKTETPQPSISAQCGNSFNNQNSEANMPPNTVAEYPAPIVLPPSYQLLINETSPTPQSDSLQLRTS
ncbi:hypothetical protein PCANC_10280 [Puccinia coronata f. sp. avenae]|uniref:Uncharacterized protein n=1 Tax=Puccinia coronata f. sp. avenae TaxID=200324 RepID=A0A2N5VQE2_9BASI|nr:hypothetical protein PCANC_21741 [Puccinia coronata f. sp. avenae]PLW30462.1 hypothetical protein PCASD_19169 [Puccinia coronata f. sp. avenae]PLW52176.1 hypothetical protein PCANC_10280 [Puccinia coronata f. sp. avenae]